MLDFLKQFILHPRSIGAIVPSSKSLAEAMLDPIDFARAEHIVELGPGTGAVTKSILRRMGKNATLTVVELNPDFCTMLSAIDDHRLTIVNGDARSLSSTVKKADYIISSLPLNTLNDEDRSRIIHEIKSTVKHSYIQFHYSPFGEKYLKENFKVTKKFVLKNIPPAIVYTASLLH